MSLSIFRKTLIARCCAVLVGTAALPLYAQTAPTVSTAELLKMVQELRTKQAELESALQAAQVKLEQVRSASSAPSASPAMAPAPVAASAVFAEPVGIPPESTAAVSAPNIA